MSDPDVKFLTLNTAALWAEGLLEGVEITEAGLGLQQIFTHKYAGACTDTEVPAAFTLDRCGLLYVIAKHTGALAVIDSGAGHYQLPGSLPISGLRNLAAGAANLYLIDGQRLYALARVNYQLRWEAAVPGVAALAVDRAENLYLLDPAGGRVLKVGRDGAAKVLIEGLDAPVAICCGWDGFLYILMEKAVKRFSTAGSLEETRALAPPIDLEPCCLGVDREGIIYFGGRSEAGFPYLLSPSGNWERLGYRGSVSQLAINARGDLYLLLRSADQPQEQIVFMERVANYTGAGTYTSKWLDSTAVQCRWHRFVLEAEIPANTQILVSYRTGTVPDDPAAAFGGEVLNPADALINSADGQYIQFRLRFLSKDVTRTPRIKGMKVYFPRVSYLRYLPAVYQENGQGKDFLERFLSLGETFLADTEDKIRGITGYFDPAAAPDDFIPWLASWLSITRYDRWPVPKIRALLLRAPGLFRQRGTREGLSAMITLYLSRVSENGLIVDDNGAKPVIVESFQVRAGSSGDSAVWGDLFGTDPYSFCVLLTPEQVRTNQDLSAVKRIVELEKPAHTRAGVKVLQPWLHLDWHTYLGLNTHLSEQGFVLGQSALSRDTKVTAAEDGGQVAVRARVGVDTALT